MSIAAIGYVSPAPAAPEPVKTAPAPTSSSPASPAPDTVTLSPEAQKASQGGDADHDGDSH